MRPVYLKVHASRYSVNPVYVLRPGIQTCIPIQDWQSPPQQRSLIADYQYCKESLSPSSLVVGTAASLNMAAGQDNGPQCSSGGLQTLKRVRLRHNEHHQAEQGLLALPYMSVPIRWWTHCVR